MPNYPPTKTVHNFQESLRRGKADEALLDRYFRKWYTVETIPVSIEQRIHADRLFIRPDGSQLTVEYKADHRADETGFLFLETVANDVSGAPGWVYSTQADRIVWLLPESGLIMSLPAVRLREAMPIFKWECREASSANPNYNSVGLIVPVSRVRRLCDWVDNVNA